jgi:hypothetical protein
MQLHERHQLYGVRRLQCMHDLVQASLGPGNVTYALPLR